MMSLAELSIPFGLGVMSSLHCAQMCGPIVLAYSLPLAGRKRAAGAHLSYNAGRLATYALLGALAGAAGGGLVSAGRLAGIERAGALVAGACLILAGVLVSGWFNRGNLVRIGAAPDLLTRTAGRLLRAGAAGNKLVLGLLMGFLPCGLVYAALLKALEAGSPGAGALSMLLFGAGTSGALLAMGFFSSAITARLGRHANALAAAGMILLGSYLLYRGLQAAAPLAEGCAHGHAL
ncbi:MAG: sulfite exporter TauE/SafE family protein [Bryobacterales bacterium]|nr:sulfite exporter TauE/SafE family protein [Bryobacterales bacterium]